MSGTAIGGAVFRILPEGCDGVGGIPEKRVQLPRARAGLVDNVAIRVRTPVGREAGGTARIVVIATASMAFWRDDEDRGGQHLAR